MSGHYAPKEPIAPIHGVFKHSHRERVMNAQRKDDLERENNQLTFFGVHLI